MATKLFTNELDFTEEQKHYLQGFFAGVAQRGSSPFVGHNFSGLITSDPASGAVNQAAELPEETYFGTPVSDLCKEERWKLEENPLDIWDKLLAHANENRAPSQTTFSASNFMACFMLRRHRTPSCCACASLEASSRAPDARTGRDGAETGPGRADLTTRGNLQIREFQPKNIVRVLNESSALGMTSRGSGADNIRNITASPITGIDPTELYDVAPLAEALQLLHLQLTRPVRAAAQVQYRLRQRRRDQRAGRYQRHRLRRCAGYEGPDVPPGIYFRVLLCGITGHKQFATDCGLLLRPDQTVAVAAAMMRVFSENGDRTDRKKARLKYLVDRWGVEKFLAETEKRLGLSADSFPGFGLRAAPQIDRAGHIGVHPQTQPGLALHRRFGARWPSARGADAGSCRDGRAIRQRRNPPYRVAEPGASQYCRRKSGGGTAEILCRRLELRRPARAERNGCLHRQPGLPLCCQRHQGACGCAGKHAGRVLQDLEPVNLHVTGCPHSCAQHYIGDIGLMGVKVGGEEGYQVSSVAARIRTRGWRAN